MAKSANLTVRVDPVLKKQAQQAALHLDVSLSQVVSAALRGLVAQSGRHQNWLADFKTPLSQELQEQAEENSHLAARRIVLDRLAVLEAKERRNELNRDSRAELQRLRIKQVTM